MACQKCLEFTLQLSRATWEAAQVQREILALERAGTPVPVILQMRHDDAKLDRMEALRAMDAHQAYHVR
jgi:hypothetical protein